MALPLLLGGAALGVLGNIVGAGANKRAAEAQAAAFQRGQDTQMQMFEQGQAATQPYRDVGSQALTEYQQLLTPEGQGAFFEQYQTSPMFQAMQKQAEDANLRAASATGGLRTGQTGVAMASIAPQLAMQGLQQRLGGLQNLYATGAGAAGQTAGLAPQVGSQIANLMSQQGAAQGAADSAYGTAFGQSLGQLGGLGLYAAQGGFDSPPANTAPRGASGALANPVYDPFSQGLA